MSISQPLILDFNNPACTDTTLTGGKCSKLAGMIQALSSKNVRVPMGFSTTVFFYDAFIKSIEKEVSGSLSLIDYEGLKDAKNQEKYSSAILTLQLNGEKIRTLIRTQSLTSDLKEVLSQGYLNLCSYYHNSGDLSVAVRSSSTAEDLEDASSAGLNSTYLHVRGIEAVYKYAVECIASCFTDRAISYRQSKGLTSQSLCIGIQKMVYAEASGVAFSADLETGNKNFSVISAVYGLGENVVQGNTEPDEYIYFQTTKCVVAKKCGSKILRMISNPNDQGVTNLEVPVDEQRKFVLKNHEIEYIGYCSVIIQEYLEVIADIEWVKDSNGDIYIVQGRPETVRSQKTPEEKKVILEYVLEKRGEVLSSGRAIGERIATGKTKVINSIHDFSTFESGDVLVTKKTDPDWEPIMKMASAIVSETGGRTSHAAILAREIGIPAIVAADINLLPTGIDVTISCSEGEIGYIYKGILPFVINRTIIAELPVTKTKLMLNIGDPSIALRESNKEVEVGLARLEHIMGNILGCHPSALVFFPQLENEEDKSAIKVLSAAYFSKEEYLVDTVAMGIGQIAAAFYPNPVIVRFSDFKSNEFANLLGGRQFEPVEENPMLGWRGPTRYLDPKYAPVYALECEAMRRVREDMGLTNVIPMVPFCRTPEEGIQIIQVMKDCGLVQGQNGLKIYMMYELPSNAFLAEEFAQIFDGFSIGGNDLTQTVLATDRDNPLVAHIFDERNRAVKSAIKTGIRAAKKFGIKIGFCGQAVSDFPEFATFLVEQGIDSISLNPDSYYSTLLSVAEVEKELGLI